VGFVPISAVNSRHAMCEDAPMPPWACLTAPPWLPEDRNEFVQVMPGNPFAR
jgi:hypothetical protein